jgi:hypothetical protein
MAKTNELSNKRLRKKTLSKRQLAVIDEMFAGELDEQGVLDKHKVSRRLYDRWLADERFSEQFSLRIAGLNRQSQVIIARYLPLAAAKLVQLTESEKEETARKACLDIMSLPLLSGQKAEQDDADTAQAELPQQLSVETASRLLAILAEENEKITAE